MAVEENVLVPASQMRNLALFFVSYSAKLHFNFYYLMKTAISAKAAKTVTGVTFGDQNYI